MSEPRDTPNLLWPVIAVLFFAEVIASLEGSMLFTALPTIARQFGLTSSSWLITGYVLVAAAAAVVGSRLGDMYGRKRALMSVLLICTIGSLISALSSDLNWIVAGRMLQGSTGAILPLSLGIVRAVSSPSRTPFLIGVLSGAFAGSAALGYVVGGAFAESGHWQYLFWLTAAIPLLIFICCAWVLPADHRTAPGGTIDILGAGLLVPAIMLIQLGFGGLAHGGWTNTTGALLGGGLALLVLWVVVELRVKTPLIDVRLLGDRKIAAAIWTSVFLGLGGMQLALVLMMLIQQPVATGIGFGVGATLAGVLKLPSNLVSLITGPLSGMLAGRRGARLPIAYGGVIMAAGWFMMVFVHDQLWHIIAGTLIGAIGSSLIMASVPNLVVEVVPAKDTSAVTGLTYVVRGVFTSIGTQIVTLLLASGQDAAGHPSEHGYVLAMTHIALMSLGTFAVALFIPKSFIQAGRESGPAAPPLAAENRSR